MLSSYQCALSRVHTQPTTPIDQRPLRAGFGHGCVMRACVSAVRRISICLFLLIMLAVNNDYLYLLLRRSRSGLTLTRVRIVRRWRGSEADDGAPYGTVVTGGPLGRS